MSFVRFLRSCTNRTAGIFYRSNREPPQPTNKLRTRGIEECRCFIHCGFVVGSANPDSRTKNISKRRTIAAASYVEKPPADR